MKVVIESIPHKEQRYPTVGDWWWEPDGTLQIRVSELSSYWRIFLVAYHEFFEAMWCKKWGVTQKDIDAFDMEFERNRQKGDDSEPGDNRDAPYYAAHQFATAIEHIACIELGEGWTEYGEEIASL